MSFSKTCLIRTNVLPTVLNALRGCLGVDDEERYMTLSELKLTNVVKTIRDSSDQYSELGMDGYYKLIL